KDLSNGRRKLGEHLADVERFREHRNESLQRLSALAPLLLLPEQSFVLKSERYQVRDREDRFLVRQKVDVRFPGREPDAAERSSARQERGNERPPAEVDDPAAERKRHVGARG